MEDEWDFDLKVWINYKLHPTKQSYKNNRGHLAQIKHYIAHCVTCDIKEDCSMDLATLGATKSKFQQHIL
jgi:hypothetical protein